MFKENIKDIYELDCTFKTDCVLQCRHKITVERAVSL